LTAAIAGDFVHPDRNGDQSVCEKFVPAACRHPSSSIEPTLQISSPLILTAVFIENCERCRRQAPKFASHQLWDLPHLALCQRALHDAEDSSVRKWDTLARSKHLFFG